MINNIKFLVIAMFSFNVFASDDAVLKNINCVDSTPMIVRTAHLFIDQDGSYRLGLYNCRRLNLYSCQISSYVSEVFPVSTTDGQNFYGDKGSITLNSLGNGFDVKVETPNGILEFGFISRKDCHIFRSIN